MEITFRNCEALLSAYLPAFKSAALSYDDSFPLHARLFRLHIPCDALCDLRRLDFGFLFQYDVFPKNILKFFGEWQLQNRELETGDTIVQQAHLPPGPLGLKLIFGVRVISAYHTQDRVGFRYGTLTGHPEKGTNEFFFSIEKGALLVTVRTRANSGLPLTRLLWPFVTRPYVNFCNRQALLRMREKFLERNFVELSNSTPMKHEEAEN